MYFFIQITFCIRSFMYPLILESLSSSSCVFIFGAIFSLCCLYIERWANYPIPGIIYAQGGVIQRLPGHTIPKRSEANGITLLPYNINTPLHTI